MAGIYDHVCTQMLSKFTSSKNKTRPLFMHIKKVTCQNEQQMDKSLLANPVGGFSSFHGY